MQQWLKLVRMAAQVTLLAPLPPEITGISIAARYRSATPGASAGGDLYEVISTGHGIRVIIGDVRGKGLDATVLARHVLSAFRRSAAAVPALEHLADEVNQAIRPHLGEEDFVTAALAQIAPSGELTMVSCGHHPPLLRHGGGLQPLTGRTADLPLGLADDFTAFTASWRPGDRLLLYTDGLVESRNQHGDFFSRRPDRHGSCRGRLRPGAECAGDRRAPAHRRSPPRRHGDPAAGIPAQPSKPRTRHEAFTLQHRSPN